MSIIKSIKQVLGLGPAAENHFWDGSVPNQLSLKRGTPDAPGATVMQVVNGVLQPVQTGPAFRASNVSNQSLANNTATKILFPTVEFDTDSAFANSTFTPLIAGYYQVNAELQFNPPAARSLIQAQIRKNTTAIQEFRASAEVAYGNTVGGSALIYMNGTTDYIEVWGAQGSGANLAVVGAPTMTVFSASLVRKA